MNACVLNYVMIVFVCLFYDYVYSISSYAYVMIVFICECLSSIIGLGYMLMLYD
jgi:hypothetical protein